MESLKKKIEEMLEHEPLKSRGLTFIGIGADRAVFETAGSARKVIKVSRAALRRKVSTLLAGEHTTTTDTEKGRHGPQKHEIDDEKKNEEEVKEIFGPEHFLRKGVFRITIPITKDFLISFVGEDQKKLVERLPDNFMSEVEILAETQLVAEELKDPESFSPISFSTDLIRGGDFYAAENIDDALARARDVTDGHFLSDMGRLIVDVKYHEVIKEIVSKVIRYTKKTGLMLDIFGPNNVTLYTKEDGSVDYHILDILMPGSKEHWNKNITQDPELRLLRQQYVYFYSLHSLADMLNSKENLAPEDLEYFGGSGIPFGNWPSREASGREQVV